MRKLNVVCIGGGTGQSQILSGLKRAPYFNLTSIVGVTDNGGHSGILRKTFGIPQVGDARNCLSALADEENPLKKVLDFRFRTGKLDGANLGNLFLASLISQTGKLSKSIEIMSKALSIKQSVIPVSDESGDICAELKNGKKIYGEWEIINRKPRLSIKRLFHRPILKSNTNAIRAIRKADIIIFCPGSLLTAIISIILTKGIKEAIRKSKACKIYVCNIMTQPGQTDNFTASNHIDTLAKYLGVKPDYFIINYAQPHTTLLNTYKKTDAKVVEYDHENIKDTIAIAADLVENFNAAKIRKYKRSGRNLLAGPHLIRHDSNKLAEVITQIASYLR